MSSLTEGLNKQQAKAVTAPVGLLLVLAGPGSGKTRVLTRRIAWLIKEHGAAPERIIAVTFTNKAAREMRQRVDDLLGSRATSGMMLGTFHSICARILRREAARGGLLPVTQEFVIFDMDDQRALVKDVIVTDLNLDDKRYKPAQMLGRISQAKNDMILPQDFEARTYYDEMVGRVYERYQQRLAQNNAVDFDDLLMLTAHLFSEHPQVLARYHKNFDHILIDEFQDTNGAQYRLVKHLAEARQSLFCVGDEDQAIYAWRGADYRNLARLRTDFPELKTILLEQNYRSTQVILDAAKAVIARNPGRTPKELFTESSGGPEITYYEASDEEEQADFIIEQIARLTAEGSVEPGGCAIMYRTNAQSRSLEEAFVRASLPYKLVGATRFYGRREVRDVLAMLRLIHNPADEISLRRVINVPPRGLGEKTVDALFAWAAQSEQTPFNALINVGRGADSPFSGRARTALAQFGALLERWRRLKEEAAIFTLIEAVLTDTDYLGYVDDGTEQGEERRQNVQELINVAREHERVPLGEFLEEISLVAEVDDLPEAANAPTLLTLHAAKGLEFDVVFLAGLEEGTLPHSRALDEPGGVEEERRLFYVGMTRARRHLYLLHSFRSGWGNDMGMPSRFLRDIPHDLLLSSHGQPGGHGYAYDSAYRRMTTWDIPARPSAAANKPARPPVEGAAPSFREGQRVAHPTFGEGVVISTRMMGREEEITVAFEGQGVKRLLGLFANLRPLDG